MPLSNKYIFQYNYAQDLHANHSLKHYRGYLLNGKRFPCFVRAYGPLLRLIMRLYRHKWGYGHNTYKYWDEKRTRMDIWGPHHLQKCYFVLQVVGILQPVFVWWLPSTYITKPNRKSLLSVRRRPVVYWEATNWNFNFPSSRCSRTPSNSIDSDMQSPETNLRAKDNDFKFRVEILNNMDWDDCNHTFTIDPRLEFTEFHSTYINADRYDSVFRKSWYSTSTTPLHSEIGSYSEETVQKFGVMTISIPSVLLTLPVLGVWRNLE